MLTVVFVIVLKMAIISFGADTISKYQDWSPSRKSDNMERNHNRREK